MIGMRFAGEEELPALARKVLAENLTDRKAITQLVKDWQGDYLQVRPEDGAVLSAGL